MNDEQLGNPTVLETRNKQMRWEYMGRVILAISEEDAWGMKKVMKAN